MSVPLHRPPLRRALLSNVVPAYLVPTAITYLNAQLIPDERLAAQIEAASYSWIAVPSALASAVVTVWLHRRVPAAMPRPWRALGLGTLAGTALALAGTLVLIAAGLADASVLQFTVSSAAVGGGLAARAWAKPRPRTRRPDPAARRVESVRAAA